MCMATVYLKKGSNKIHLLEEVASINISGKSVVVKSLFGKQKKIHGMIKEVDFLNSTVLLEKCASQEDTEI